MINTKQDIRVNICNSFYVTIATISVWLCLRDENSREKVHFFMPQTCCYSLTAFAPYSFVYMHCAHTHTYTARFYLCNWACKFALKLYVDTDFLMVCFVVATRGAAEKSFVSLFANFCLTYLTLSFIHSLSFPQDFTFSFDSISRFVDMRVFCCVDGWYIPLSCFHFSLKISEHFVSTVL